MAKQFSVAVHTEVRSATCIRGTGYKAGLGRKKGWFQRFLVGIVPQRGVPGAFVVIEYFMKRVGYGDWYSERVKDEKTGQIIHQCDEPLSKHQGHGSAKIVPPREKPAEKGKKK